MASQVPINQILTWYYSTIPYTVKGLLRSYAHDDVKQILMTINDIPTVIWTKPVKCIAKSDPELKLDAIQGTHVNGINLSDIFSYTNTVTFNAPYVQSTGGTIKILWISSSNSTNKGIYTDSMISIVPSDQTLLNNTLKFTALSPLTTAEALNLDFTTPGIYSRKLKAGKYIIRMVAGGGRGSYHKNGNTIDKHSTGGSSAYIEATLELSKDTDIAISVAEQGQPSYIKAITNNFTSLQNLITLNPGNSTQELLANDFNIADSSPYNTACTRESSVVTLNTTACIDGNSGSSCETSVGDVDGASPANSFYQYGVSKGTNGSIAMGCSTTGFVSISNNTSYYSITYYDENNTKVYYTANNLESGASYNVAAFYNEKLPFKDGYTFNGWDPSIITLTSNSSTRATFTKNLITYYIQNNNTTKMYTVKNKTDSNCIIVNNDTIFDTKLTSWAANAVKYITYVYKTKNKTDMDYSTWWENIKDLKISAISAIRNGSTTYTLEAEPNDITLTSEANYSWKNLGVIYYATIFTLKNTIGYKLTPNKNNKYITLTIKFDHS